MTASKRICLISHFFSTHRGGVEIVAGRIAAGLADECHEIEWLASDTDPIPTDLPDGVSCTPLRACNITETKLGIPWPIWSPAAMRKVFRAIRRADVVHVHEYEYAGILLAFVFATLLRKPIILTQHVGLIPYDNALIRGLLSLVHHTLGRLAFACAAQVVFISENTAEYFADYRTKAEPLLIPNGYDTAVFHEISDDVRQQLRAKLGFKRPTCLFVGRFVEKKGLDMIESLARRTPEIDWILVGWGVIDPDHWDLPNVSVRRGLASEQIAPLYQAADLLVLPSRGEGFPLVIQEGMACGLPAFVGPDTAAASSEARPALLCEEVRGADVLNRWQALLESFLADDREAAGELRSRAARIARDSWSWQRCSAGYSEILKRLGNSN